MKETLSCGCVQDGNFRFPCETHGSALRLSPPAPSIPFDVDPRNEIIRKLELQNGVLKGEVEQKTGYIRELSDALDDIREHRSSLAERLNESNRLNGELKALLWRARDAVTDHDFPKSHRYEALCIDIELTVGPGDRCRHCGALASRETTHVCAEKPLCKCGHNHRTLLHLATSIVLLQS